MRVLMLTHNMAGVGGSFIRCHSLGKHLAAMGHQITLLAGSRQPRWRVRKEEVEGVRVVEMPDFLPTRLRHGGLSPLDVLGRLGQMTRTRYDVVHGFDHRPSVSIPALVYQRWRGIPCVADWADLWGFGGIADERQGVEAWLLGRADHAWEGRTRLWADGLTVVCSDLQRRALAMGVSPDDVRLIPPGANVDVIRPLSKEAMRSRRGLPVDGHIAVHIGMAPYDADLLGRTIVELIKRDPQAWVLLAGVRVRALDRLVEQAEVEGRVVHAGFVPYQQLGEVLACGDVMLLPFANRSVNIGRFPNKVGDYLAAGRPIVTNPTGGLGWMIHKENVGVLTEESPEAFAGAVKRLFDDADLCEELGRKARHLAVTKLAWQILARTAEAFYHDLLSRSAGSC